MDRQWLRKRCCRQALAAFTLGGTLLFSSSAGAAALSLNEAIDYALAKNTGLRITREGERTADAALRQARGKNSVSAGASDSLRMSKQEHAREQISNGISLSASLPLYSGGHPLG